MRMRSLKEAQENLPALVEAAQSDVIGLTDETGSLVGLLAGLSFDDIDDLLVETAGFQEMMARARASIRAGRCIPAEELEAEIEARLAEEEAEGKLNSDSARS